MRARTERALLDRIVIGDERDLVLQFEVVQQGRRGRLSTISGDSFAVSDRLLDIAESLAFAVLDCSEIRAIDFRSSDLAPVLFLHQREQTLGLGASASGERLSEAADRTSFGR